MLKVDPDRYRLLREGPTTGVGPVVYWMSRDMRCRDNWALLLASQLAKEGERAVAVLFCLTPEFLGAARRQYAFLLAGLQELQADLQERGIAFLLRTGQPGQVVPDFLEDVGASSVVCDFDPLRIKREWQGGVAGSIDIPVYQADAHNIVPCWQASDHQEYAARTFRPRIHRAMKRFFEDLPPLPSAERTLPQEDIDWYGLFAYGDQAVPIVKDIHPGERGAWQTLRQFLDGGLARYRSDRNDPSLDCQSHLSPYLHFGQISAQRVALAVFAAGVGPSRDAFLEELVVRKELSDNFCYYQPAYDSVSAFPAWARASQEAHIDDPREYLYTPQEMEKAQTHDPIWNAAQMEMVGLGRMHGYLRMYWAKKILEWSESPEKALATVIRQNDRYQMDGRDPNGYAGAAWSCGGVHDRAFADRMVTGKVRYMSYRGLRSKFDMDSYISRVNRRINLDD